MKRSTILSMLLVAVCAMPAAASVIYEQGGGDDYVAFEAELFDSLVRHDTSPDKGFIIIDTTPTYTTGFGSEALPASTNASGGAAILDDTRVSNADHSSTITYKIIFAQAGDYRLYYHYSHFEDGSNTTNYGNEDSFYLPSDWNTAANVLDSTGGPDNDPINHPHEGLYFWRNAGDTYTVTVEQVGQVLEFNIDDRESGYSLDRFVFSTTVDLNSSALDALSNTALLPTPAALPAGLGLLTLAALKRRRA